MADSVVKCEICLKEPPYPDGRGLETAPCGHTACRSCWFGLWKLKNRKCPFCREQMDWFEPSESDSLPEGVEDPGTDEYSSADDDEYVTEIGGDLEESEYYGCLMCGNMDNEMDGPMKRGIWCGCMDKICTVCLYQIWSTGDKKCPIYHTDLHGKTERCGVSMERWYTSSRLITHYEHHGLMHPEHPREYYGPEPNNEHFRGDFVRLSSPLESYIWLERRRGEKCTSCDRTYNDEGPVFLDPYLSTVPAERVEKLSSEGRGIKTPCGHALCSDCWRVRWCEGTKDCPICKYPMDIWYPFGYQTGIPIIGLNRETGKMFIRPDWIPIRGGRSDIFHAKINEVQRRMRAYAVAHDSRLVSELPPSE